MEKNMQDKKVEDFTSEEIMNERDLMYSQITRAQARLAEIRSICKHTETFEGNYSYRIGVIMPAIICSHCGELIKY